MRSDVRARTNSIAVCLATSMRLAGAKSSASMLLDMSMARTIEMPSLWLSDRADPRRGPAAATIHAPRHTLRSVTGSRAIHRRSAAPTTAAARPVRRAGRVGRSSGRELLGQAPRPRGQARDIRALGAGEGDAIELLQHVPQLAYARLGPRPLDHGETLVGVEGGMRRRHRPRERGPQPPRRAGGHGPRLTGRQPARVGHLTFQWNWRWRRDLPRRPAPRGDA